MTRKVRDIWIRSAKEDEKRSAHRSLSCGTIFLEFPALYYVCNVATFGMSEVGVAQLVVDGVKLIIAMEKRLEAAEDIDHLVPTQK